MKRWQAFAIHFSISLAVFLVLLTIIITVWFPGILFTIDAGWKGLLIVVGVDLVLGPLLTLIVFKSGKPGLKFDLTCIALFQVTCMTAGMWIVYSERPLALVLAYDTVYSLAAQEFEEFDRDPAVLENFPGSYPKLIYTELPENAVQADIVAIRSQYIGDPLFIQTERYKPMPEDSDAIRALFRQQGAVRETVKDSLLEQLPEGCVFSKFVSAVTTGFICLNPETGALSEFYESDYLREPAANSEEPLGQQA